MGIDGTGTEIGAELGGVATAAARAAVPDAVTADGGERTGSVLTIVRGLVGDGVLRGGVVC